MSPNRVRHESNLHAGVSRVVGNREKGLAERFDLQIDLAVMRTRHAACQQALDRLAEIFAEVQPDVAVIFGNDQMEIFNESLIPAFSVMWGPKIMNSELPPARRAKLPPGVAESVPGHIPPGGAAYRGAPELAVHVMRPRTRLASSIAA